MVEALENHERAAFLTVKEIKSLRSDFDLSLLKESEPALKKKTTTTIKVACHCNELC